MTKRKFLCRMNKIKDSFLFWDIEGPYTCNQVTNFLGYFGRLYYESIFGDYNNCVRIGFDFKRAKDKKAARAIAIALFEIIIIETEAYKDF